MTKRALLCTVTLILFRVPVAAQSLFTDVFPIEEFRARRLAVMQLIGDGVAILEGATEKPAEAKFRQNNNLFYLTGIEVPRVILVLDGRTHSSVAYIPADYRSRAYGPSLTPGSDAARVTGLDAVLDRDEFAAVVVTLAAEGRTVFVPHDEEVLGSGSRGEAVSLARANADDPWDGRTSRADAFIQKLKAAGMASEIQNLDPILRSTRAIKSAHEIDVIRRATQAAGLGIMEAMRDARPGMYEYELQADAEFVFKKAGAQGAAYFALVATGTNTLYSHYHFGTAVLADGDMVQFDYAPDLDYYVSDVTRVFPANGRFSARQREFYTIYLELYQALMTSIRVHAAPRDIIREAVPRMDAILASFTFTDAKIEAAARSFVERYRNSRSNSLGHTIGLEVHDVPLGSETLEPGHIFTIEPAMTIADEHIGIRLEDVILITATGYENLSAFVPTGIDEIEALMAQPGLSDTRIRLPVR